jgi:malonate decarboxylase alpha subunit
MSDPSRHDADRPSRLAKAAARCGAGGRLCPTERATRLLERGIANRLDFAYAGPQSRRLAELVASNAVKIGAIHTYLELYARMLVDLTPQVALVVADKADRDGNRYTGPNTEDTPTITEATAFRGGIVVAQVNEIVDHLPRVNVPGDWVNFVIPSPKPYLIDPLFTRDPAKIRDENVLWR